MPGLKKHDIPLEAKQLAPVKNAITRLERVTNEHGYEVQVKIRKKKGKHGGQNKYWSKDRYGHVWLAVQMQKHLKKTKNISATLEQIFLNGRILSAHLGVRDDDGVGREIIKEISNKDTAKRLYDEAVARMKDDPKYKKEWERSLETGKWVADKKWGVTAVHKGGKILLRMGPGVTPSSRS